MISLGVEEGLEWEFLEDETQLEQVSEFKSLGCVLVELVTDVVECRRKVASGRNDAGTIRSFTND